MSRALRRWDLDGQLKRVRSLMLTGKATEALALTEKLVGENPGNGDALSSKAEVLLAMGRPDDAAQLLDAAVSSNPQSVDVRLARARFLSDRGLHQKALVELERVSASATNRARCRVRAGPRARPARPHR